MAHFMGYLIILDFINVTTGLNQLQEEYMSVYIR